MLASKFKRRRNISPGIRQKGEFQNACYKKIKPDKFFRKETFLTPWYATYVGVSGMRNVLFSENLMRFVLL